MSQGPYLLGMDIGGTGANAGVFTLDGRPVETDASGRRYPWISFYNP